MSSNAGLILGSLALLSTGPTSSGWWLEASSDGTDWGNPDAVIAKIASVLLDGDRGEVTRYGNRTVTIQVRLNGENYDQLSIAEAVLDAEVRKSRNTLIWRPPGYTTPSVFDVVYSDMRFIDDKAREFGGAQQRVFALTLSALPFARRETLTTTVATPVSVAPTMTSIDDATTLTNWQVLYGGTPAVVSGTVVTATVPAGGNRGASIRRNSIAATSLASGEFIAFEVDQTANGNFSFLINNIAVIPAYAEAMTGTIRRYYLPSPTGVYPYTVTSATVNLGAAGFGNLIVRDLSKASGPPLMGSGRERSFLLYTPGTARTEVDLLVEAGGGGNLGEECFIFTAPQGKALSPPLRTKYQTAPVGGAVTPDVAMISGSRNNYNGTVYTIPAAALPPGTYLMIARVNRTSGVSTILLNWTASLSGASWYSTVNDQTGQIDATYLNATFVNVTMGILELPPVRLPANTTANVTISFSTGASNIQVDETWLYNLDTGVLSQITTKVGASNASRLLAASATVDRPRPAWYLGTAGSDVNDVDCTSRMPSVGRHVLMPGLTEVFVALMTGGATNQTITGTGYDRYHTHVPPVGS